MADDSSIQFAGTAESRLIFSGPPDRLQGTIPLFNPTAEKLKLRTLGIRTEAVSGPVNLPLQQVPCGARLSPGEQANVQSTISLDPHTPPGKYDLQVTIGSRSIQASAYVTDVVDFRIEPGEVTILSGATLSHEREFVIENGGNVPLPLGERCEAPLLDSVDLVTSMLVGLRKAGDSDVQAKVKAWLEEWAERAGGTLVVTRDAIVLRPGQKITAKAQFQLPADLKPFRHYRATLQLYNASLSVNIYTTKKAGTNDSGGAPASVTPR